MSTILQAGNATSGALISSDTAGSLQIQTGSSPTTAITVDTSQNVIVGATSPTSGNRIVNTNTYDGNNGYSGSRTATVLANSTVRASSQADSGNGQLIFGTETAHNLNFITNNVGRMIVDTSGNLLVGTSTASYSSSGRGVVEVNGSSESLIGFKIGGGTTNATYQYNTSSSFETSVTGSRFAVWTINGSERMRITSSGEVDIGGTQSFVTTGLYSNKATTGSEGMTIQETTGGASTRFFMGLYNSANTKVGGITTNGSTTTFATSSDYRLKENIAPMTGALARVAELKPVTYTWKDGGSKSEGFIAHELQSVCPEAVVGEKDAVNEDGSIKPQGIDTSFLVATLTAAIQEQQALIIQLQADVAALKGAK